MTIMRVEKNANYTTINNTVLNDVELSWQAKGMAAYLLSRPDGWEIKSRHLSTVSSDGTTATLNTLKELEERGYLTRICKKNAAGQFEWEQIFHEVPTMSDVTVSGKPAHGEPVHIVSTDVVTVSKDTVATSATSDLPLVEQRPTSTSVTTSLAEQYRTLLAELETSKNRVAVLARVYALCFGQATAPTFSYIGRVATAVGGAGRLAQLMFELIPRQVSGDKLAYIMSEEKARKKRAAAFNGGVKETKFMFDNGDD